MGLSAGLLFLGAALLAEDGGVAAPAHVRGTIRNASGVPLSSVEIASDTTPLLFRDRSDRAGMFDVRVEGGARALVFDGSGYCRKRVELRTESEPLQVVLDACSSIQVRVSDGRGRPIAGLPIRWNGADGRNEGSDLGSMLFGVPPGRIRITVGGRPDIPERMMDVGSKDETVTLKAAGSSRLRVRIVDGDGLNLGPFVRAALVRGKVASPVTEDAWARLEPQLLWPGDGNRFSGLAGGVYTVLAAGSSPNPIASTQITLGENATRTVTVRFPGSYRELP